MSLFNSIGFSSPNNLVTDGLVYYVDASQEPSYPGSGTSWFNMPGLNTKTGTLTGGVTFESRNYGCLRFNGSNAYVTMSDSGLPTGTSSRTLAAYVFITGGSTTTPIILNYGSAAPNQAIGLQSLNSGASIRFFGFAADLDAAVTPNLYNRWAYVVGVWDGTRAYVYVDGILLGSNTYAWNTVLGGSFEIGKLFFGTEFLAGLIPVVQIYNIALSQEQIQQNYNYFKPRYES